MFQKLRFEENIRVFLKKTENPLNLLNVFAVNIIHVFKSFDVLCRVYLWTINWRFKRTQCLLQQPSSENLRSCVNIISLTRIKEYSFVCSLQLNLVLNAYDIQLSVLRTWWLSSMYALYESYYSNWSSSSEL